MAYFNDGSRLGNQVRTWMANEDADWGDAAASNFIVAGCFKTGIKVGHASTVQLQWRNVTDEGSFVALSGSGELNWNATSALNNNNLVEIHEKGCVGSADNWEDGIEREGENDVSCDLAARTYTEIQWAVKLTEAHPGAEYEFRLWDVGESSEIGVCLANITRKNRIIHYMHHYKQMQGAA